MKTIKLSECNKEGQIFLYNGETVGLQYILRQIYYGKKLPEIQLCCNQEQLDKSIEDSLMVLSQDLQNGAVKESYSLGKLDTVQVEINVESKDINKVDEDNYIFELLGKS